MPQIVVEETCDAKSKKETFDAKSQKDKISSDSNKNSDIMSPEDKITYITRSPLVDKTNHLQKRKTRR